MLLVWLLPSILFPPKPTVRRNVGTTERDTTAGRTPAPAAAPAAPSVVPSFRPSVAAETVWVTSPLYRLGFSTRGGALVSAELLGYRTFAAGDAGRPVQLVPPGQALLVNTRTAGADTTVLADWSLTPSAAQLSVGSQGATLTFAGERGGARV